MAEVYCTTPQTPLNFAYNNKATLVFPNLPNFTLNVVGFTLPTVVLPPAMRDTPLVREKVPGDKLEYAPLSVKFLIKDGFGNWNDMYRWMRGLGFPQNNDEYKNKPFHREDVILIIYSAYQSPVAKIKFESAWPTALSEVDWTTQTPNPEPLTAIVALNYTKFDFLESV